MRHRRLKGYRVNISVPSQQTQWHGVGLMLSRRLRRANIKPTLFQRLRLLG